MFTAALSAIARTWKQLRCPLTDERIQKLQYINTMEYYSAIKRNAFESILMRWMNLEPIIQSELSQKNKHNILMHIYGIQVDGTDEPICRATMETESCGLVDRVRGKERVGQMGRVAWKHTLPYVKQISSGNFLYDSGTQTEVSNNLERWHGVRSGREVEEGENMYTYG